VRDRADCRAPELGHAVEGFEMVWDGRLGLAALTPGSAVRGGKLNQIVNEAYEALI